MKIQRGYKTELDPNDRQRTLLLQHAGAARVAYNWGLRRKIDAYQQSGESLSAVDLHRELNRLKDAPKDAGGFPWMRESSKCAPQEALRDLDRAFRHFFRRCKNGAMRKGFPRFKSRKHGIGSFRLTGVIKVGRGHVQLPRLGRLRLKEHDYLPEKMDNIRVLSATVTERAGRWFVSLQVEQELPDPVLRTAHVIGVDVGVHALAVVSDGRRFENPKALRAAEMQLRRRQKAVSRKVKGSQNRRKAVAKVARLHYRISNIRRDSLHKTSSAIAKSAAVIVLESLNMAGMIKNRCLSKALSDASIAELHRQIAYKARWSGGTVIRAGRFYPSSKMCSHCGHTKQSQSLNDRTYECDSCGLILDRDLNAAINLRNLAVSFSTVTACGEDSSGPCRKAWTKLTSMKQEPNTDQGLFLIGSV